MEHLATSSGRIAWRVLGPDDAPAFVVCHGGALDHTDFLPLAEALQPGFRVVLWDLPGHGESGRMPPGFSLGHATNALNELLDELGLTSAVLLGFSFGGMVAQDFLRRYPDRVSAVVLYACFAPFLLPPPIPKPLVPLANWALWGWRGWAAIQAAFAARCSARPDAQARVRAAMAPLGKQGFMAFSRALLEGFTPDPSFRVTVPSLLLRGAADSNGAALVHSMDALARAATHPRYVVVPGAGHCWHMEDSAGFIASVTSFLATLGAAAGPAPGDPIRTPG